MSPQEGTSSVRRSIAIRIALALRGWLAHPSATWALFLALPFAMFAWLMPFVGKQTIGNDYTRFAVWAQLDLMWSVHKGTFPLYMPGFGGGHSSAALTLGQLYHPISWLSSLMPGYWSGLAVEWLTFFRLLSLGFVHLVLHRLCRRLSLERVASFLCTFPVVYNLRMLDSFRYAAALEGYVGMLLVAAAGGMVYLRERSKGSVVGLAVATALLTVSGHPQWAFLGMLAAVFFLLLFPWIAQAINPDIRSSRFGRLPNYYRRLALGMGVGILVSSPYLLTFLLEFFRTNQTRAANTAYDWTLGYSDTLRGELSNFLFPLHADVHGAFGGSAAFLMAALFPLVAWFKRPSFSLIAMYLLGVLALSFAAGQELPVHRFIVQHVPFFGSFRTPGRLVLWIPLATLPLLAWLMGPRGRLALGVVGLATSLVVYVATCATSHLLPKREFFSPHALSDNTLPAAYDSVWLLLAGGTALAAMGAAIFKKWSHHGLGLALIFSLVSTWLCLSVGTWREDKRPTRSFAEIAQDRRNSLNIQSIGPGMETRGVTEYMTHGLRVDRPLGVIVHRAVSAGAAEDVLRQLASRSDSEPLFVQGKIPDASPQGVAEFDMVTLVYNTSNRFTFEAIAARDGFFVLGLPWLPGFTCRVDGKSAPVAEADALFSSVFLPRGFHVVDFRFVSWPFLIGVAVAFGTLGGFAAFFLWPKRRRQVAKIMLIASVPAALVLWLFLYAGPSFEMVYKWQAAIR